MYPLLTLYDMVDVGGLDLADVAGKTYPGLYNKLLAAMSSEYDIVLYNWYCAKILLPPADVTLSIDSDNFISINGIIFVRPNDTVYIPSMGVLPVIEPLSVVENGIYYPDVGVDGFSEVNVAVPQPSGSLSIYQNGTYNVTMKEEVVVNVVTEWENITSQATFSSPFSYQAGTILKGDKIVLVNLCLKATATAAAQSVILTLPNIVPSSIFYMILNDKGIAVTCYAYNNSGSAKIVIDNNDTFTKRTNYPVLIGYIKTT